MWVPTSNGNTTPTTVKIRQLITVTLTDASRTLPECLALTMVIARCAGSSTLIKAMVNHVAQTNNAPAHNRNL
ncbi:MAG: hypothetical protein ACRDRF_12260, partial [Pseudonocardiaceae bacterium]